ncbi:tRNA (guanosine(46)-N7)-methyltransferase TrmB [Salsuginibacillus kocurii]|uniref:tRNA (guanosine(46)-N7)-methyltransferase TrmB n=1 Tax=Salsuginibacillus kocurii TaxID=427078 RepID=UPI000367949F|nr:tRNA (guanosine(46)-N7)-methyltransferase TrmB [Salsuginibacillus kocurii]
MRMRHKPWAAEYLQEHSEYVVQQPEDYKGKWSTLSKGKPIYIEVGTGKGQFVTEMALKYPDVYFIGIEKFESVLVTAVQRAVDAEPDNLLFIHGDVGELDAMFASEEVQRVYNNFTDPWPKKRHEKRRLTYQSFLALYDHVLTPNGEIHVKTDNQGYFEYSLASLSHYGFILKNISLDLHASHHDTENVRTEYEEKFAEKGQPIYRVEAMKQLPPND